MELHKAQENVSEWVKSVRLIKQGNISISVQMGHHSEHIVHGDETQDGSAQIISKEQVLLSEQQITDDHI